MKLATAFLDAGRKDADVYYYYGRAKASKGDHAGALENVASALEMGESAETSKYYMLKGEIHAATTVNNNAVSLIGLEGRPSYFNLKSIADLTQSDDSHTMYSPREREILRLLAEGLTSKEIASYYLHLSSDTIRTHRKNILVKGGSRNTAHAIATAVRNGLI